MRSWHSDPRVQAGLGSACFLLPLLWPLEEIILKLPFRLVKYDPLLIDCPPAYCDEGQYFYLPTTNIIFKEQLRLFHFPSKLRWAQTSNVIFLILKQDLASKRVLKHVKFSNNLMFRDLFMSQDGSITL